ncbi:RNA polymerase epsilon subunit [Aquibacillus salsiterrae]|uniref:RNA polymerase epsilon subunit n=1 Tax=Aquibacillus salsiterrae TaxID=2950439 RepID=A0A9X3WI38_9BACI|nr:RNA polymerase epsilon subunit [Aquibacillus salsiterrae]MDC3417451.1 RNA polymerase epsilon subunit [Aquibacillus salsiterrae]
MLYKIIRQGLRYEVPVQNRTTTLYDQANLERHVLRKRANHVLNMELIQQLNEAYLGYGNEPEYLAMEMLKQ